MGGEDICVLNTLQVRSNQISGKYFVFFKCFKYKVRTKHNMVKVIHLTKLFDKKRQTTAIGLISYANRGKMHRNTKN